MTPCAYTLGEPLLRFSADHQGLIETAGALGVHVGGAEANVAVGLARLGTPSAVLTQLPDNSLGSRVRGELERFGVDTSLITTVKGARMGLYFHEEGPAPRGGRVIYDRAGSAMANLTPADLPLHLFADGAAGLLHTTGITLGIGDGSRAAAMEAMDAARQANVPVSFDINHRSGLWDCATARPHYEAAIAAADVVFVAERDIKAIWPELDGPEALHRHFAMPLLVVSRGAAGALAIRAGCPTAHHPAFPVSGSACRIGRGDAFAAGFLHAWLNGMGTDDALAWGCASAAFKYTLPGDLPLLDASSVANLVATGFGDEIVR
ncbi:bifunctional 2-dehydro-3-deoxygluconokinase/2-dehydro-3-deoxygalactonoki nase [Marinobacter nanhaiticus D15-8W]|nr:sugar kinase [Marinobacter nanhaiticus]BES70275.1 bifunctional 2-dehydro-3-deoxygluconokinase/2-dehydro-3-deoxygalactonoki nase [Marinobacter nanhaiticus D15-8W]